MKYILKAQNCGILERFACGNVLLAFDFDGTLAPIVSSPESAALRPSTARLLRRIAMVYPCIVVSGRSREDVQARLSGIRFRGFIGNHGIDAWSRSNKAAQKVEAWIAPLKEKLASFRGVVLENKRYSLSVHYRNERHKKGVCRAVAGAARFLPGARLVGGKQVINIVLASAPNKGMAVERARRNLECDTVIYIGDDETDESIFVQVNNKNLLTIRVGANRSSHALFYIRNQREIDGLLRKLIVLRAGLPSNPSSS